MINTLEWVAPTFADAGTGGGGATCVTLGTAVTAGSGFTAGSYGSSGALDAFGATRIRSGLAVVPVGAALVITVVAARTRTRSRSRALHARRRSAVDGDRRRRLHDVAAAGTSCGCLGGRS